jgi:hypothetical protein
MSRFLFNSGLSLSQRERTLATQIMMVLSVKGALQRRFLATSESPGNIFQG